MATKASGKALVAGKPLERVLGDKTIAAGVAGPEIADDVVGNIGGRFRSDHGIRANRASRQVASTRAWLSRDGRQDFSNCWHRDLLAIRNLT